MAKQRTTKAEAGGLGLLLLVFGVIMVGIGKVLHVTGLVAPSIICIAGIGAFVWHKKSQRKKRLEYLRNKYRDDAILQHILDHHFWQRQTSEQLIDSLGNPTNVDKKVLKTRKRDVWKYNHRGANRYGLRITLDNDVVIGWVQKND
jgi:hypothetical protein